MKRGDKLDKQSTRAHVQSIARTLREGVKKIDFLADISEKKSSFFDALPNYQCGYTIF